MNTCQQELLCCLLYKRDGIVIRRASLFDTVRHLLQRLMELINFFARKFLYSCPRHFQATFLGANLTHFAQENAAEEGPYQLYRKKYCHLKDDDVFVVEGIDHDDLIPYLG